MKGAKIRGDLKKGYNYTLGKVLVLRQEVADVEKKMVADGNHRCVEMKALGWKSITVLMFTAPKGIFVCVLVYDCCSYFY